MKKFIAFMAAATLLVSCSKDADQLYIPATKKMKRVVYENGNYAEVNYDESGKVKTVVNKAGVYLYTKTFTHSPGTISYLSVLNGKKTEVGDFTIVNGKVTDFTWTYFDAYEAPINTFHETYEYNVQGLLSKHNYDDGSFYIYTYNNEGDLMEQVYHDVNGTPTDKFTYSYTSLVDKFPWFSEDDDSGHAFLFPAESKHLEKGLIHTKLPGGTINYEYSISHELDKDGYVVKSVFIKTAGSPGGYTVMNEYVAE